MNNPPDTSAEILATPGSSADSTPATGPAPRHAAPRHLFRAIELWDADDFAAAQSEFEQVLALQPKNDLARSYLALCQLASGDAAGAAEIWKRHAFSDNAMFRVRVAEYVESRWLEDGSFLGQRSAQNETNRPSPSARTSNRAALRRFYRRDFAGILRHLPPSPVNDDLGAFLGATACEMLRDYDGASVYLEPLRTRRSEWPDAVVALAARLDVRAGRIAHAAREFASIVIMGPEDFGISYYLGIVCLAYEKRAEARAYFLRAFSTYMVDTREFQWWQLERTLLASAQSAAAAP